MKKDKIVLAIESSCDETGVAIVKNGTEVLASTLASQIDIHKKTGGVIPEVASREHVKVITHLYKDALDKADITIDDVDAVAVTQGPGLVGALFVGINAAKAIALKHDKPLIGVHHIAGHIYASRVLKEFEFPTLVLVASGGHTELVLMRSHYEFEVIGETFDDAVGEAFDKVARLLDLGYPGGPKIDKLSKDGEVTYEMPKLKLESSTYDFSFSGIKSHISNLVNQANMKGEQINKANLAASFQKRAVDILVGQTLKAAKDYNVKQLVLAGGVAANSELRSKMTIEATEKLGLEVVLPPLSLCTDNALMIALAGSVLFEKGYRSSLTLKGNPSLELLGITTLLEEM